MKYQWTWPQAFTAMSDQTKEAMFDRVVQGRLQLPKDLLEKLSDWAYPPDPEEQ